MIGKIKKFFLEAIAELKKVAWSTKQEVINSTWIILISTAFLGLFIAAVDFALSKLIGLVI